MGPCRIAKRKTGACGATADTIVARNLVRMIASGASAHSDHGRDVAHVLLMASKGEAADYAIKDEERLQELAEGAIAQFRKKLQGYAPKMNSPWSFTNVEKKDIQRCNTMCVDLADVDRKFQEHLAKIGGPGEWPQREELKRESADRIRTYTQLSGEFVVPEYSIDYLW
jgi:hydroxylamine reductase (hybrid-cluster protein)